MSSIAKASRPRPVPRETSSSGAEPARPAGPISGSGRPVGGTCGPATAWQFEQRLRDRALSQGRQGRLAETATSWEILTVLRPAVREYRVRLDDTRHLIDTAVPERLQRGAQAIKRGDPDAAAAQYLAALALQPDNAVAAEALRNIERERNRRGL